MGMYGDDGDPNFNFNMTSLMDQTRRKDNTKSMTPNNRRSTFILLVVIILSLDDLATALILSPRIHIHNRPCSITALHYQREDGGDLHHNDDDEDDDDDEPPEVDVANFKFPSASSEPISFGYNRGRSSPNQRKAMGRSSSSIAKVYLCTNCGSESVKWMGRCPTCKEWNTLQEHVVTRQSDVARPSFGGAAQQRPSSWLDGVLSNEGLKQGAPIRITDLYPKQKDSDSGGASSQSRSKRERIFVPNDDELNTVLGGGIMPGSLILIGGDPGVGKSTLLLQTAGSLASLATPTPAVGMGLPENYAAKEKMGPVWYCSGEESPEQIASRSLRLGIDSSELWLLSETHADSLCAQVVEHLQPKPKTSKRYEFDNDYDDDDDSGDDDEGVFDALPPSLVVIDSIQTMTCDAAGSSAAGGVTQVRECVALFLRLAKSTGIPIMLVGHVTKSGDVAGPRTVEHMVDCVLYLEGAVDPAAGMNRLRILRASKNRFGSSDEVGVYEMTSGRLLPVSDPSSLFLSHRMTQEDAEGCAVAIALEGMRAITTEVQALVAIAGGNSGYGRRTVDGIANARLSLLMGVLQKRCGIYLSKNDIYVNVAGMVEKLEKSADLAVAVALVSSHTQIGVRADTAFVGEVGLLGELRPVVSMDKRIQEARRMGFSRVVSPQGKTSASSKMRTTRQNGIEVVQCRNLYEAITAGLIRPIPRRRRKPKSSSGEAPGSVPELGLTEILDDEDDDEAFM